MYIIIDCLKHHQVHGWVTASKQKMQNIVMATVVFSLDNTEQKFADLTRNQLLLYFKGLFGLKVTLVKFTYLKARVGIFLSVLLFPLGRNIVILLDSNFILCLSAKCSDIERQLRLFYECQKGCGLFQDKIADTQKICY